MLGSSALPHLQLGCTNSKAHGRCRPVPSHTEAVWKVTATWTWTLLLRNRPRQTEALGWVLNGSARRGQKRVHSASSVCVSYQTGDQVPASVQPPASSACPARSVHLCAMERERRVTLPFPAPGACRAGTAEPADFASESLSPETSLPNRSFTLVRGEQN